jgi:hypothetical protein
LSPPGLAVPVMSFAVNANHRHAAWVLQFGIIPAATNFTQKLNEFNLLNF